MSELSQRNVMSEECFFKCPHCGAEDWIREYQEPVVVWWPVIGVNSNDELEYDLDDPNISATDETENTYLCGNCLEVIAEDSDELKKEIKKQAKAKKGN